MPSRPTITLLGPQRLRPTLADALRGRAPEGPIATITAGWQEREGDDQELDQHLEGRTGNLALYRRAEAVFQRDPELARAHRERQERLRRAHEPYALRLAGAMDCAYAVLPRTHGE